MQKKNREERIELLRDETMIQFVTESKRGGLTSVLGDRLAFSRYGSSVVKETLERMRDEEGQVDLGIRSTHVLGFDLMVDSLIRIRCC